jgi:predicted AlkP superfamily phosphohydrolase/phosphomutase
MLFSFGKGKRLIGVGLDGVPFSLADELMSDGTMPNLQRLAERGTLKRIRSVFPTVSGVAWSAWQTGGNPGEFGVYGFVELERDFDLRIPNHGDLKCTTVWQRLEGAGRKFAALGVPMTYPPPESKNVIVSGFLAPALDERAVSNPDVLDRLRRTRYEVDIDPQVAIESPERFKEDLSRVSEARWQTALSLLEGGNDWDFFFVHVMDTDRLNHFMWRGRRASGEEDGYFWDFYGKLDSFLGRLVEAAGGDADLLVCSDHGFCELKWEVQLNRWLKQQGYLDYENDPARGFKAIKPGSRAFSLVPGRVHILREGKWDAGIVTEKEYDPLRREIMGKLRAMTDPATGDVVCRQVMKREEVFHGPHLERAPDIVVDPCDGYDLKSKLGSGHLFEKGPRTGMHTYDDAMLLVGGNLRALAGAEDIAEVGRLAARHVL